MAIENKFIKKIINVPLILRFGQDVLGANSFKRSIYGSVFATEKRGKILDFGCSYGNTADIFESFEYYGVDIDCQAIEGAKDFFKNKKNFQFECLDIMKSEYKLNFFDHILFASTSHHISNIELTEILHKLLTQLKPGGAIHFFDIFRQPGKDKLITRLLTRFDQGKYIRKLEEYESLLKNNQYIIDDWKIFSSPNRRIKLWDFLYVKIVKSTDIG